MSALARTAITPVIWGTTYYVTSQFLPPDRPLLAGALRALPAGLALVALTRRVPTGRWWFRAAVLGTLNIGLFFAALFVAAYRLPGGVAAVLGAIGPLWTLALSAPVLGTRPATRGVVAGFVGVAGVALVVLRPGAALDPLGVAAGLAGTVSMASATVLAKRWGRPDGVGALAFTGWQLVAGGLLLAPVALAVEGLPPSLTTTNLLGYAYLGAVGTAAAYALWFRGIAALPASSVQFLALLSPVTATIVGWAALGQSLSALQAAGMVVALAGTALGVSRPARPVLKVRPAG